jgi:hypothetical protein
MRLFISYRRSDSTHAAHRVRMCLQARFGADAVFIDREIPAGKRWEEHLESMLEESTGVVVMVGDEFLRRIQQGQERDDDAPDAMAWEIATAIRLQKAVYPVLFGSCDMPDPALLPQDMRAFTDFQAVFAREPAFDAAMDVLTRSIANEHDWVPADAATPGALPSVVPASALAAPPARQAAAIQAVTWAALALAVVAGLVGLGRLILWLAHPQAGTDWALESALWHGTRYALATALWGLGPYLAYWLVAALRARARLPIYNVHGMLTACNVAGILVSGGTFLLLSTLPGWHLQPLFVFPPDPGPWHYAALAAGLLTMVIIAVAVAVWEPRVRTLEAARRVRGMRTLHAISLALVVCGLWFAASLAHSLPPLASQDPVPIVGYVMLCPALSVLLAGWTYAQSHQAIGHRTWQMQALFGLVLGLYLACTLALFAHGPTRLLAPGM